jgi:hypothetical protein
MGYSLLTMDPMHRWPTSQAAQLLRDGGGRCTRHLRERRDRLTNAWVAGWWDGRSCWGMDEAWLHCRTRKLLVYGYPPTPLHLIRGRRNPETVVW